MEDIYPGWRCLSAGNVAIPATYGNSAFNECSLSSSRDLRVGLEHPFSTWLPSSHVNLVFQNCPINVAIAGNIGFKVYTSQESPDVGRLV